MTEYEWNVGNWAGRTLRQTGSTDEWTLSTHHRDQIANMVNKAFQDAGNRKICIWGAGKCNDIDLAELTKRFLEVHLVDIDSESLQTGISNQSQSESQQLVLHPGIDLGGIDAELQNAIENPSVEVLQELIRLAADHQISGIGQYDMVISTCVLSQIICSIVEPLEEKMVENLVDLVTMLRNRHAQLMIDHLLPGGRAILVTDIVSSDSLPELAYAKQDELKGLLYKAIEQQNFFHGLNPMAIERMFNQSPIKEQLTFCSIADPWVWRTPDRVYAVIAVAFEKAKQDATNG